MNNDNNSSATITRTSKSGLDAVVVSRPCFKKFYITVHPGKDADPYGMFDTLGRFLQKHGARIVSQDVFGSCKLQAGGLKALQRACGKIQWPVTWIEGDGSSEKSLTGTQVYAISGTSVEPIYMGEDVVGNVFEDDDSKYCLLGDLRPTNTSASRPRQVRQTFEKMEAALDRAGMDFTDVVRTWLYIDKILSWYGEFNRVRTDFFAERAIFNGVVPASTGIGAANCAGLALVGEAVAIKPKKQNVSVTTVASPLQCPAPQYNSSFSRAVEVALSDHRRLYISGTASIEPGGKTAHVGRCAKQIDLTMRVVRAILKSRQMDWKDVSRAIAYFKNMEDAPLLDLYCKKNNLPALPIAIAHGDICRDDLLFEIEADAVVV
jgi:enamine deaminase RidA (YjgF/YER057c/UK114 family)